MTIRTDDVLHHLVARSAAPSSFGSQLDRMRYGISTKPDPFRARDDAESQMLEQAGLLRCIDAFAYREEFRSSNTTNFKKLEKVQRASRPRHCQGTIALNVLRAYQEWSTQSQERALVAVYQYLATIAPEACPPPPKNEPDLVHAFRTDKAKRCRTIAAEIYADALLALGQHLTQWNRTKH
jgi:hypothetical protein